MNRPVSFDPAQVIGSALEIIFGSDHAVRWPGCVEAAGVYRQEGEPWTWFQMAGAFIIWTAMVEDDRQLLEEAKGLPLSQVILSGHDGTFDVTLPNVASNPQLAFIAQNPVEAVILALTQPTDAARVVTMTLREDNEGGGAIEMAYAVDGVSVTALYGDRRAPADLVTCRVVSGNTFRHLHRALADALAASVVKESLPDPAEAPPATSGVRVGVDGPFLPLEEAA